jgi:hypothetical protein
MEENRYYTPEKEEFHYGFEFQWRDKPPAPKEESKDKGEVKEGYISSLDLIHDPEKYREIAGVLYKAPNKDLNEYLWQDYKVDVNFFDTDRDTAQSPNIYDVTSRDQYIEFRVPYLTKEDIESEGFKFTLKDPRLIFRKSIVNSRGSEAIVELLYNPINHHSLIYSVSDRTTAFDYVNLFVGKIKNKSEFKAILKAIGL